MIELFPIFAVDTATDSGALNQVREIADQVGVTLPKLGSQIILFAFVLIVLRKFAFGPVQKILAERQKLIEKSLDDAEKVRQELADAEVARKEIVKKAEIQAAGIIKDAQASAEVVAQRRLADAAQEANQIVVKTRESMQIEQARLESELRQQFSRLVAEATQKVTGKILTPEDHARLNAETIDQLSRN